MGAGVRGVGPPGVRGLASSSRPGQSPLRPTADPSARLLTASDRRPGVPSAGGDHRAYRVSGRRRTGGEKTWWSRNAATPRSGRPSCRCWQAPTSSFLRRTCTVPCGPPAPPSGWPLCTGPCRTWPAAAIWIRCATRPAKFCTDSVSARHITTTWCAANAAVLRRSRRRASNDGPGRWPRSTGTPASTMSWSCSGCARSARPSRQPPRIGPQRDSVTGGVHGEGRVRTTGWVRREPTD